MRKTAIIISSRQRYSLLGSCLESIRDNSKDNVEVYIGCDSDDVETLEVAKKYKVTAVVGEPSNNRHYSLLNPIARGVDCDYIFTLNDDTTINTKNFGSVIEETIEEFLQDKPDRIVYGRLQESWPGAPDPKVGMEKQIGFKYACYPVMTKETINCLGFVMPNEIPDCGADIELGRIFNTLKCSNIVPCQVRYLDIPVDVHDHIGARPPREPWDFRSPGLAPSYYLWHGGLVLKSLIKLSKHIESTQHQHQLKDDDYSFICEHLPMETRINEKDGVPVGMLPPGCFPIRVGKWLNPDSGLKWHRF